MKTKKSTQELKKPTPGFGKQLMLIMKKSCIIAALALFGFNASAQCTGVVAAFSNTTVCLSSATQFTDLSTTSSGTITSWSWDFGDSSPVNNTSNPSYTYANAGNYNVSLIVVNNSGCADTTIMGVTVNSASVAPTMAEFSQDTICEGSSTILSAYGGSLGVGADYNWYSGSCGGTFIGTGAGATVTPSSTTTYFVRAEGACNTTSCASVTIIVNSVPVGTASPASQTICSGDVTSIALSSNIGGATFSWTVTQTGVTGATAGSGSTIAQTLAATGISAGTAIYTISQPGNGCGGNPTTVTVMVNPLAVVTALPSSQTVCSGDSTSIILSSTMLGTTYFWTVTQSGVSGASAGWSGSSISQTLTTTGTSAGIVVYTISHTTQFGCIGSDITVTVTVNPQDDASFTYTSATFCQSGANQTPVITGLTGGTFSSTPAGLVLNSSTGTIDVATSALGAYTVTYTTNGICPNTSSVIITINTASSANFTYSGSPFYQNGTNPSPIFGSGASAGIFTATPAGLVFVNVNTGEIDVALSAPGTYTITNTIPVSGTCPAINATTTIVISGCASYTSLGSAYINSPFGSCVSDSAVIDFTYLSYTNLSGSGSSSLIFNWGDGVTDTYPIQHNGSTDSAFYAPLAVHLYTTPGIYTVMLTFYDAGACYNDTIIGIINVSSTTCGNLTGTVFNDANNDCTQNNGELGVIGIEILLTQGINTYTAWTDSSGNYAFNVPTGAYTIEVNNLNAGYSITCSGSLQHATTVTSGTNVENFAISCTGAFDVAVTGISLMDGFYPGTGDAILPHVGILNAACNLTIPGQVKMILEPCIQYSTSGFSWFTNPPDAVIPASTGDTLVWYVSDINNIGSFSYWDYAVNVTTCTSAQVGDTVCITMMVLPTAGDADLSNNTYTRCFAIGVSYDPNYKEVEPKGAGVQGFIPPATPNLTYTINFQNTGTAVARNIYVLDSIDADLNINSIEILSASHGIQVYRLPNNTLKFMFANIMLPDSTSDKYHSHGYLTFRIKPNTGLAAGTQIKNTGNIYFDYNEPVATNTVLNTIAISSGINEIKSFGVLKVAPNPAKDKLVVSISSNGSSSIIITDVLGKIVWLINTTDLQTQINVSDLQDGIYFIKLSQGNATYVEKIIISK